MKCPNCKNEVFPEWKRCPYCEYKPHVCSKQECSYGWLPNNAHFCPLCGSPVKGEENLGLKEIIKKTIGTISSSSVSLLASSSSNLSSPSDEKHDLDIVIGDVSFKMISVKGGSFLMGATEEQGNDFYNDERPVHRVTLSDYYIGETVVTQALWKAVMGYNPSYYKGDNLPVEKVSWDDCHEFLKQLNKRTGKTFSLPSEAEWEYAARGGNKSKGFKYAGSNDVNKVAWYSEDGKFETHVVRQKEANELGLYDMSGNVREWCQDNWKRDYNATPDSSYRVVRGGGCDNNAKLCRVTCRYFYTPSFVSAHVGFRLILH